MSERVPVSLGHTAQRDRQSTQRKVIRGAFFSEQFADHFERLFISRASWHLTTTRYWNVKKQKVRNSGAKQPSQKSRQYLSPRAQRISTSIHVYKTLGNKPDRVATLLCGVWAWKRLRYLDRHDVFTSSSFKQTHIPVLALGIPQAGL